MGIPCYLRGRLEVQRLDGLDDRNRSTEAPVRSEDSLMANRIKRLSDINQRHGQWVFAFLGSIDDVINDHDVLGAPVHWLECPLARIASTVLVRVSGQDSSESSKKN